MKMYNINSVAKITGLTAFVIRAWEKRYNVVVPGRTETNRRFYSEEDIEKLRLLKLTVDSGNSIRNVAGLSVNALKEMLSSLKNSSVEKSFVPAGSNIFLIDCIKAVELFDDRGLESSLIKASMELSHPILLDEVVIPLLNKVGVGWSDGAIHIAQEHIASAVIRTFLYNLRESYKRFEFSKRIILTTPLGHTHEFGALIASIVAASEGWNSIYLGPDLPSSEIIVAASRLDPKIVGLSFVFTPATEGLTKDLENLKHLPEGIKIVAGGAACRQYQTVIENLGGVILDDMNSFRNFLRDYP